MYEIGLAVQGQQYHLGHPRTHCVREAEINQPARCRIGDERLADPRGQRSHACTEATRQQPAAHSVQAHQVLPRALAEGNSRRSTASEFATPCSVGNRASSCST